jgi:hypothetical protein
MRHRFVTRMMIRRSFEADAPNCSLRTWPFAVEQRNDLNDAGPVYSLGSVVSDANASYWYRSGV